MSTILIVDDKKENRLFIKTILKNEGYNFLEAQNGKEALDILKKNEVDIILLDIIMPIMDGFETAKIIRSTEEMERIPILMITTLDNKEAKIKALEIGVNDFITKPFDIIELKARCKSYIQLSKINKKYILSIKNPETNLLNEIALLEDLKKTKGKLILIRINNLDILNKIFPFDSIIQIKKDFAKELQKILDNLQLKYKLYQIDNKDCVVLIENNDNLESISQFIKEKIEKYSNTINNLEYLIDISIAYSHSANLPNLLLSLNLTQSKIINADEIIKLKHYQINHNLKIIKIIKKALEKDNVVPYLQGIVDNKTQKFIKYEVLMRIIDNEKVLTPFFFLEIAKDIGYYYKLSFTIIKKSLLLSHKFPLSINITTYDLEDDNIPTYIFDFLKKNPSNANNITFEILESETTDNYDIYFDFIKKIKKVNAKIAIDDFGSGYSNFERILSINPDYLKIDGSLIKNILTDKNSFYVVETINTLAKKLNIKTIGEFVENKEIFETLKKIGIDYSQGYYFDKPKQPIESYLINSNSPV